MMPHDFEDELRAALHREDPPPGFAGRVLARAAAPRRASWLRPFALALAAALLLASAGLGYRDYQGRRAKQQVLLAMRITGFQWHKAQVKVREAMRIRNDGDTQ